MYPAESGLLLGRHELDIIWPLTANEMDLDLVQDARHILNGRDGLELENLEHSRGLSQCCMISGTNNTSSKVKYLTQIVVLKNVRFQFFPGHLFLFAPFAIFFSRFALCVDIVQLTLP